MRPMVAKRGDAWLCGERRMLAHAGRCMPKAMYAYV